MFCVRVIADVRRRDDRYRHYRRGRCRRYRRRRDEVGRQHERDVA